MNKNNKFLWVMMMVMLTMFSITISAKEHADDKSCRAMVPMWFIRPMVV